MKGMTQWFFYTWRALDTDFTLNLALKNQLPSWEDEGPGCRVATISPQILLFWPIEISSCLIQFTLKGRINFKWGFNGLYMYVHRDIILGYVTGYYNFLLARRGKKRHGNWTITDWPKCFCHELNSRVILGSLWRSKVWWNSWPKQKPGMTP